MRANSTERLYRVDEAAEILGFAEVTVRTWIRDRKIAHVRVGERGVRIPQTEMDRLTSVGLIPARQSR